MVVPDVLQLLMLVVLVLVLLLVLVGVPLCLSWSLAVPLFHICFPHVTLFARHANSRALCSVLLFCYTSAVLGLPWCSLLPRDEVAIPVDILRNVVFLAPSSSPTSFQAIFVLCLAMIIALDGPSLMAFCPVRR